MKTQETQTALPFLDSQGVHYSVGIDRGNQPAHCAREKNVGRYSIEAKQNKGLPLSTGLDPPPPAARVVVYVGCAAAARFTQAVRDYNETRASDVFVVNFGAHYNFPPGEDDNEKFKADVFPILDAMAELGDKATVVWRCDTNVLPFSDACMYYTFYCSSPPTPPPPPDRNNVSYVKPYFVSHVQVFGSKTTRKQLFVAKRPADCFTIHQP